MKAAVFYGNGDLRVEEVDQPLVKAGEVKLRVALAGICGSDLHVVFDPGGPTVDHTTAHPLTGATMPQILGHEFSGTVVEIGEGVTGVAVGDRVAVYPFYSCGACDQCANGHANLCRLLAVHGYSSHGGGMSEFTTVPASMVHVLPPAVDLRLGALVEPMAVGWHAVKQAGIRADSTVLVVGAGPVGIGVWLALRARGVSRVLVSEPSADRREAIARLGAEVVDPAGTDLDGAVAELTDGTGVSVAFDAAGAGPAVQSALAALGAGGRLVVVALHSRPVELALTPIVMRAIQIVGSVGYDPEDFDEVIAAMAEGLYSPEGWVDEAPLDDLHAALTRLRQGSAAKILIAVQ